MDINQIPYASEAEQAIIGGLLIDNQAWPTIADKLQSKDFYDERHQWLFERISTLAQNDKVFDLLTILDDIKSCDQLLVVGGEAYVLSVAKNTPTAANISAYADVVKTKAQQRQLIEIGQSLVENAIVSNDVTKMLQQVNSQLLSLEKTLDISRYLTVVGIADFLQAELPQRDALLAPWLPRQGLAMIYAKRGVGKTHIALNIAYAVASGGVFLGWEAPKAKNVLYIDGEMPAVVMQERLADIVKQHENEAASFNLLTPDMQGKGMPDLSTLEGQRLLAPYVEDVDLIVIDNISTLCRTSKENEAEGWVSMQEWALKMRSQGRSVLFVHHAAKNGNQRGTSKREDVLDTVMMLKHANDYDPSEGAAFEVHFEKSRSFYGDDAQPLQAKLVTTSSGQQTWQSSTLDKSTYEKVVELSLDGLAPREIVEELDINKSTVSRHLKRAKDEGLI